MTQEELYIEKCHKACQEILDTRGGMPLAQIVVYGSLARGRLGMGSDIDVLLVLDANGEDTAKWRKYFNRNTPAYFTDDFPYVDVRFARKAAFDSPDDSEFGDYIRNCREDGICVWHR